MPTSNQTEVLDRLSLRIAEVDTELTRTKLVLAKALVALQKELGTKKVGGLLDQLTASEGEDHESTR